MVRITNPNISLAYNLNHYQPSLPGDGDDDLYHVVVSKRKCWRKLRLCSTVAS